MYWQHFRLNNLSNYWILFNFERSSFFPLLIDKEFVLKQKKKKLKIQSKKTPFCAITRLPEGEIELQGHPRHADLCEYRVDKDTHCNVMQTRTEIANLWLTRTCNKQRPVNSERIIFWGSWDTSQWLSLQSAHRYMLLHHPVPPCSHLVCSLWPAFIRQLRSHLLQSLPWGAFIYIFFSLAHYQADCQHCMRLGLNRWWFLGDLLRLCHLREEEIIGLGIIL